MGDIEGSTRRGDGHLVVYVLWPLCGGAMLGVVFAICAGGIALLNETGWQEAGTVAAGVGLGVFALATGGVFVYAMLGWGGPLRIEKAKREVVEVEVGPLDGAEEQEDDWWRVINQYLPKRRDVPLLPASVQQTAESAIPRARPEIEQLYRFVTTMWPTDDITQANCRAKGFTRKWWDRYIGGSRRKRDLGKESARGLLDRAGVIYKEGNEWRIGADLATALSINPELRAYADALSQVVRIGQVRRDKTSQGQGVAGASGEEG